MKYINRCGTISNKRLQAISLLILTISFFLVELLIAAQIPLRVSNLEVSSGRQYFVNYRGLRPKARAYIDRNYIFSRVPTFLCDKTYIVTDSGDKFISSLSFISFWVNKPVTIYIAHDRRYTMKPSWLSTFNSTGESLTMQGTWSPVIFDLYKKSYPVGKIVLGGNIEPGEHGNYAMFTIIIIAD